MDLTPEEKAIGRENFAAAIGSAAVRRDFLNDSIRQGLASGRGLGPYYFGYDKSIDPIRVGVIGTGDEGCVLIGAINPDFLRVEAIADIRPYSVHRAFHGDWYSDAARAVRCGLLAKYGWKTEDEARKHVRVYGPYEDLDGVIIALPLHLHAPAALAAMKAGMHVLTEKLMAHTIGQCKQMARAAKEFGKHLATGHQRHYSILYDNAVQAIQKGVLGDLHYIRAQWHRGNLPGSDSWQQPMPKQAKPGDALAGRLERELAAWQRKLEGLQKNDKADPDEVALWQARVAQKIAQIADETIAGKPVEGFGYENAKIEGVYDRPAIEELIRWRLWNRTGGGLMAELGSHQLDASSIFVASMFEGNKKQHPLNVAAMANRPLFPVDRDVDDHVYCLFEFPAPQYDPGDDYRRMKTVTVAYASINGNGWGGYGETVFGTEGTLILDREEEVLLYKSADTASKTRVVETSTGPRLETHDDGDPRSAAIGQHALLEATRGYTEQLEHWAWCIRKNPDDSDPDIHPRCYPKVALGDAVIALTTNIAARLGRRVDFDPAWFDPDSDAAPEDLLPEA